MVTKPTLDDVRQEIGVWQANHKGVTGQCLGCTRWALQQVHMELPFAVVRPGHHSDFAIDVGSLLATNPAKWGWKLADIHNLPPVYLGFFKTKHPEGHVGVVANGVIYSDVDYPMSPGWRSNLRWAFVPL